MVLNVPQWNLMNGFFTFGVYMHILLGKDWKWRRHETDFLKQTWLMDSKGFCDCGTPFQSFELPFVPPSLQTVCKSIGNVLSSFSIHGGFLKYEATPCFLHVFLNFRSFNLRQPKGYKWLWTAPLTKPRWIHRSSCCACSCYLKVSPPGSQRCGTEQKSQLKKSGNNDWTVKNHPNIDCIISNVIEKLIPLDHWVFHQWKITDKNWMENWFMLKFIHHQMAFSENPRDPLSLWSPRVSLKRQ